MIKNSKAFVLLISAQAKKDIDKLSPKLKTKLQKVLLTQIIPNPYMGKKLLGDLQGSYSFRLTYKDRIVYTIDESKRIIYLQRARTHYGQ